MGDIVETLGKSVIQHGKYNDRVYLIKLAGSDFPSILDDLDLLAISRGYSKIFAKVPASAKDGFIRRGYIIEAYIPGFFNGSEDAYFMGKYLSSRRLQCNNYETIDEVIAVSQKKFSNGKGARLLPGYKFRQAGEQDAKEMASLYALVFKTYPFPIYDPGYLVRAMADGVAYFAVCKGSEIIALSSAEADEDSGNVEMTDFATHPNHRGKGFSAHLLGRMEEAMSENGLKTAYTIARSTSFGMNIAFAKMGYRYSGTLINNTNISGSFESMNVWYKKLTPIPPRC